MQAKSAFTQYLFIALEEGDRFYFLGDKKKIVHEMGKEGKIRRDGEMHFSHPTIKQKGSVVIYLRKTGTIS